MELVLKITGIVVIERTNATDLVIIKTTLPPPYPPEFSKEPLDMTFQTSSECGADYVRKHFGCEPEVIASQKLSKLGGGPS